MAGAGSGAAARWPRRDAGGLILYSAHEANRLGLDESIHPAECCALAAGCSLLAAEFGLRLFV